MSGPVETRRVAPRTTWSVEGGRTPPPLGPAFNPMAGLSFLSKRMSPMGYTHYYTYSPESPQFLAAFGHMMVDAKKIIDACLDKGLKIVREYDDDSPPEINERLLRLNGWGEEGHETFLIDSKVPDLDSYAGKNYTSKGFTWAFCKTAQKNYDLAVTAVLLRCAQLCPDAFVIDSDGTWASDWAPARELVHTLFDTDALKQGKPEDPFADIDTTAGPPTHRNKEAR